MPKYTIPVISTVVLVIMLLMMNFTTPSEIGPFGVLVFFGLIYVLMYGISWGLVRIFTGISGKKAGKKHRIYAAVIAFGPILLLLAQSMGQANIITVGLTILFIFLGCFYIDKKLA